MAEIFQGEHAEFAYQLLLSKLEGVGCKRFQTLLKQFGQAKNLFSASRKALCAVTNDAIAEQIHNPQRPLIIQVNNDLRWQAQPNHHIISLSDNQYPKWLREIASPPPMLYVQGDVDLLNNVQIAIVGSRRPTDYGLACAHDFAFHLACHGVVITSGLALGIDASAHQGALAGHGKTIAVAGTGLNHIHPKRHRALAEKIIANGAIVSEFPLDTPARAANFPRRNRIISGLARGILVVEAAKHSGSLITARYGLEQNRDIYAIPGSIHSPMSAGSHELLHQGAKLVQQSMDILEDLPLPIRQPNAHNNKSYKNDYIKTLAAFCAEFSTIDELIAHTQLTVARLSSILLGLEMQGLVESVPGGYKSKVGCVNNSLY